ncbi:MAG: hypothetical protein ABFC67_07445 [Mizugakiibacter sp.]|uniref:hypothetical protein n=1 Tax=Mizugakiibacter sp. TaxID=1972610 RepID=UPI00320E6469
MANPIASIILTAVDKTKAAFASVKHQFDKLKEQAGELATQIAGIFGIGLTADAFIETMKGAIEQMDAAGKSAQKIGTSVENFSALTYAAKQSDVPVEALEKSLVKLARTADDAKSGLATALDPFQRLRIDPKQFTDPAELLLAISERFAAMPDGVDKAALSVQLFGKSGADLIPLLNEGRDGIRELTDEAKQLGVVFDDQAAKAAETFNDNLDKLKTSGKGFAISVSNDMLPGMIALTNSMAEAAKKGGIASALFAGLKFVNPFSDFLTNDSLDPIYRLSEAEKQLQELRADGFDEDNKRIQQLKTYIPLIRVLADAERQAGEAKKEANKQSEYSAENRKAETEAFKKATNEQIADAERLKSAIQSAFEGATRAEEDYLRQAKKLRDEANGTTPVAGDVQSQASAQLDAITRAMKLQREAGTASLQSVQDQSAALQQLAGQLDDQALKSDLIKQAKLAEATAFEKAAADEKQRYTDLGKIQDDNLLGIQHLKGALDGIGKEVSVEIKLGKGTEDTLASLREMRDVINQINATPITLKQGASGTDIASALRTEAAKYGRRP